MTRTCSCSGMFADVELRQVCSSRSVTYGLVIRSSCALRTSVLLTFFYFYNVRFTQVSAEDAIVLFRPLYRNLLLSIRTFLNLTFR